MSCRIMLFVLLCSLLESCAVRPPVDMKSPANPKYDYTSHGLFGARPDIIPPHSLHTLSPDQVEEFDQYFHAPTNLKFSPTRRLYNYLEKNTQEFSYLGKTLTATEALQRQEGNCMSLAMLTTALARRVGINFDYQLMVDTPVFEQGENVIIKGVHVRTKLLEETAPREKNVIYLSRAGIIVDYFPNGTSRFVGNLKESQYISRYYLNKDADAIESSDFTRAYWLALEALKLNDLNDSAINTLAVIYKCVGALDKAEEVY